jgi:glycine betaine/proline transport system substrate-binding protein
MQECPNVAALLNNVNFDITLENEGMAYLIRDSMTPTEAATKALKAHPDYLDKWLAGVTTTDGRDGQAAVKKSLGL